MTGSAANNSAIRVEKNEDDWICDSCKDEDKCLTRCEDLRGWIYEEQITLCINNNTPSYESDDYWVVVVEDEGDR